MTITWHSFDLKSGRRGPHVHTHALGRVKRIIGEPCSTQLEVLCYDPPDHPKGQWDEATLGGRTMLVALDEDEHIHWGGVVLRRVSGPESMTCTVETLEHYLTRRHVGDLSFTLTDTATVAESLVEAVAVDGVEFLIDAEPTGVAVDIDFFDDSDKTIASAIEDLDDTGGGVETTVELQWADADHTRLERVLRIRSRLGRSKPLTTMWTMPGAVTGFTFVEDATAAFLANDTLVTAQGSGAERPQSTRHVDQALLENGWARFESRRVLSQVLDDDSALEEVAASDLQRMRLGLTELSVVAQLDAAPRLGVDWWLGDDITVSLTCPRFPARVGPDMDVIPGFEQRLRPVGVEIDFDNGVLVPITRAVEPG